uniref:Uncharacterized protein n=1 Tax=Pygocentrus nattereri TaxID=42514 RepID=A0A3B4C8K5_PYGNA
NLKLALQEATLPTSLEHHMYWSGLPGLHPACTPSPCTDNGHPGRHSTAREREGCRQTP